MKGSGQSFYNLNHVRQQTDIDKKTDKVSGMTYTRSSIDRYKGTIVCTLLLKIRRLYNVCIVYLPTVTTNIVFPPLSVT